MAGGPVLKLLPVSGTARPRTMLEVVRRHAPAIYESIVIPGTSELDAISSAMKKALSSQDGVGAGLKAQIHSLPPSAIATILLNVYKPEEHTDVIITGPDVIEFIARWKGGEESIDLPRYGGGAPAVLGITLGSAQSFELYAASWHDGLKPGREPEPDAANSEFSILFGDVLRAVEELTAKNARLLGGMASDAAEFLACLLAVQPVSAAASFGLAHAGYSANVRNISDMQPQGAYADICCGNNGIIALDELHRPLLLLDSNALMTETLRSYASRVGRGDADVRTCDVVSASYEPGSLGLANIEFSLHHLSEPQIADALSRIVPALGPNGVLHIWEPQVGCCRHESPAKISAIRESLARHGLFSLDRIHQTDPMGFALNFKFNVEFFAARRPEDRDRAAAVRDSLPSYLR
jgi:hypothetical protein